MARLQGEVRTTIKNIVQLVWFMRGAISYHEMLTMTHAEREIVKEWVEEHLDTQKKSMYPVY
jgi:hypothetical protein